MKSVTKLTRLLATGLGVLTLTAAGCYETPPERVGDSQSTQNRQEDDAYDDAKQELQQAGDAIKDLAEKERDAFVAKINDRLEDVDRSIEEMKQDAKEATGDARRELEERIQVIETKRDALEERLQEVGDETGKAWGRLRERIREAWDELKQANDRGVRVNVGEGVDVEVGESVEVDVDRDGAKVELDSESDNNNDESQ